MLLCYLEVHLNKQMVKSVQSASEIVDSYVPKHKSFRQERPSTSIRIHLSEPLTNL